MTFSAAPVTVSDYARRTMERPLPLTTRLALVWVKALASAGYALGLRRAARERGPALAAASIVSYRPTTPFPTPPPDGEVVAVVIPALISSRAERACLGRALDALAAQTPRPPDWVIVVDDGSRTPLPPSFIAARVPSAIGFALLRLDPNAGPAAARNAGMAAAADRGSSLIAFMDADVAPRPGWLAAHVVAQALPSRRGLVAGLTLAARGGRGLTAVVAKFHDETGTLNGRLLSPDGRHQQQPRREAEGGMGSGGSGSGMDSSGSGWAPGAGGEGGRHAGRLPVPVPAASGPAATTTTTTTSTPDADAGDGGHARRRPRRLGRHHPAHRAALERNDDDGDETMQMLYACTCNLSLALTPHPPGRSGGGAGGSGRGGDPSTSPTFGTLTFDPSFRAAAYEDIDLCLRAVQPPFNLPLTFTPNAEAEHRFVSCPLGVAAQFRRYGMHERHFTRKHPTYLARLASSVAVVAGGAAAPA